MHALTLAIVGSQYPNKRGPTRRFELEICQPGEPIELRPEPNNPADEHAVGVFSCRGIQLGYIPSERAVLISKWLREGREVQAIFQAHGGPGGFVRAALDGEVPMLPEPDDGDEELGDPADVMFWPDEEWPD